jgi:large subunit ribosomal protein L13
MKTIRTYSLREKEIAKDWHVIDATGQTLGRLATGVAILLMGKHKPTYSPHLDMGDYVIVINAERVHVTGKKFKDKVYYRHTGYMGGLKATTLERLLATRPQRVIELAVRGMLPKNRLGRQLYRHLKVYAGPSHPHQSQVTASQRQQDQSKPAGE